MTLSIDYRSEGFKAGAPVPNGYGSLDVTWDDLLWAAVTVGRPNRQYIFKYGTASMYEALFRLSMVRKCAGSSLEISVFQNVNRTQI